jgi:carbon-monoxide dehydrogenase medium subunit
MYVVPETVDAALAQLTEHEDEAKILAGGQSLIPMLNMRLARPGVLVDINRISALDGISTDDGVVFGALARHSQVLGDPAVRRKAPLFARALGHVGHVGIRSRGTIGGSIAHADAAAELPVVLLALDGSVVARSPRGARTIESDSLYVTNFTTELEEDEIITHVRVPAADGDTRSSFYEVARRHGDFALVLVATTAEISDGVVARPRIALGAVADRPVRATQAEEYLVGKDLDDPTVIEEASRIAAAELDGPPSDVHASSDFRREVAGVLVKRALSEMATGGID